MVLGSVPGTRAGSAWPALGAKVGRRWPQPGEIPWEQGLARGGGGTPALWLAGRRAPGKDSHSERGLLGGWVEGAERLPQEEKRPSPSRRSKTILMAPFLPFCSQVRIACLYWPSEKRWVISPSTLMAWRLWRSITQA